MRPKNPHLTHVTKLWQSRTQAERRIAWAHMGELERNILELALDDPYQGSDDLALKYAHHHRILVDKGDVKWALKQIVEVL